jgi:hypothetical protein
MLAAPFLDNFRLHGFYPEAVTGEFIAASARLFGSTITVGK